ncbi:ArgE/DapE family deacylase [Pedococcus bigeumensis]|uniref:ArgE/DapE family deacylase n=1 Tax=Pedococcus bigeumensis TaxID=433644 RepID=UPI002FE74F86
MAGPTPQTSAPAPGLPPQQLDDLERRLVDSVDVDALVADLAALVACAAVGGSPGESAIQRWAATRLRDLGLEVVEWEVDLAAESAQAGFPGMEVTRDELVGVVGTWPGASAPGTRGGAGGGPDGDADGAADGAADEGLPALALCGHTDVVPVDDPARWRSDPFRLALDDGLLTGRGACDMLGGVAAVLGAVRALRSCGVVLARPLAVHLVSGEEDGGAGAFATLRAGHSASACVIAEPTGGAVIPANAGSLTFRLEVEGRAAHGSTRTAGENALDHLAPVQAALRELEARRNVDPPAEFAHLDLVAPISIGIVRSGTWASTVPDLLVAEGRYGVLPGEPLETARSAFEDAMATLGEGDAWLTAHPVRVSWPGGAFASGSLPAGHGLLDEMLAAAASVSGRAPRVEGAPYGSDLRHYAAHGIPTVQFGPGDLVQAHAVDESVRLDEVVACAQAYAVLAPRRCGAPPQHGD